MSTFTFTLPEASAAPVADVDGVNALITDHADRAVQRLAQQFRKPKIEAFLRCLIDPLQILENVSWQLLTEKSVDNAIGAQLDMIGAIVRQPRAGFNDDDYRRLIRARISVNKSNGTVRDIIRVARLVIDDVNVAVEVKQSYPAAVVVKANDAAVTTGVAELLISFLLKTVAAGVRVLFHYTTTPPAAAFSFLGGPGLGFGDGAFASAQG